VTVATLQVRADGSNRLGDELDFLATEGWALLHAYVEEGATRAEPSPTQGDPRGVTLVVQGRAREVTERRLPAGPLQRPTRAGHPLFWGVEHNLPAQLWEHASRRRPVRGRGLHLMPLGPVRGDVAESLAYQLVVLGDEIHEVRLRAGYKRRHVALGMSRARVEDALSVAERVTGTSPVAHGLAFSRAVEAAAGLGVAAEAVWARMVVAELERVTSHVGDLAVLAAATGTIAAAADWFRLKERLLRYQAALSGHRYLRGVVAPGGLRRPLSSAVGQLAELCREVSRTADGIRAALDRTNSYLDRLYTAGLLPDVPERTVYWTGFVGKSAGLTRDLRWDCPYDGYPALTQGEHPMVLNRPDAYGRYWVRVEEVGQSLRMLAKLAEGAGAVSVDAASPAGVGLGFAEAPRGRLCYRVEVRGGRTGAVSLTTPSLLNWPAVPAALVQKNILQDFPIIDASFNLAVAALDL
jgi:formate hydrogenlyase subunit 5